MISINCIVSFMERLYEHGYVRPLSAVDAAFVCSVELKMEEEREDDKNGQHI